MCPLRRCRRLRRWIGKGFFFPPGERCGTALPAVENKKLSCRTETARCFVSLSHSRSLKVIENGTIRKFGYSFLFIFHRIYAVSLAVWTQYTNVTHTRQTPHDGMLRLCIASRGKNGIFFGLELQCFVAFLDPCGCDKFMALFKHLAKQMLSVLGIFRHTLRRSWVCRNTLDTPTTDSLTTQSWHSLRA